MLLMNGMIGILQIHTTSQSSPMQAYNQAINDLDKELDFLKNAFEELDFAISKAGKYGIKLILSLVNNYKNLGGRTQYVDWARSQGQYLSSDEDFLTNSVVKGYYKNHIKTVRKRKNSMTRVAYKDEPTIMAWELMNEPQCTSDRSGETIQARNIFLLLFACITELAPYLKSIDGNHLLEPGLEGFYGKLESQKQQYNPNFQVGTDFGANNQITGIDFAIVCFGLSFRLYKH
ncbi:unnamed protein product [Ilex paraguariensis]|uniref:mannan endo-1,4-beta-mannosidase n=1 Tax=Ilex paraguariensis TaxID=185542 RepID=A0ABC8TBM0_9AQUA